MKEKDMEILRAFRKLQAEGPLHHEFGICFNVTLTLPGGHVSYFELEELFEGWEHHTGNPTYPVPVTYDPRRPGTKEGEWEGRQREYREDLIAYCIKKLEARAEADMEETDQEELTPIQVLAETARAAGWDLDEVLVPEQCMSVQIGRVMYHISVGRMTEDPEN